MSTTTGYYIYYAEFCFRALEKEKKCPVNILEMVVELRTGCQLASSAVISSNDIIQMQKAFTKFAKLFIAAYGTEAACYNVHQVVHHLHESFKNHGPGPANWLYGFEGVNGMLGKKMFGSYQGNEELTNRIMAKLSCSKVAMNYPHETKNGLLNNLLGISIRTDPGGKFLITKDSYKTLIQYSERPDKFPTVGTEDIPSYLPPGKYVKIEDLQLWIDTDVCNLERALKVYYTKVYDKDFVPNNMSQYCFVFKSYSIGTEQYRSRCSIGTKWSDQNPKEPGSFFFTFFQERKSVLKEYLVQIFLIIEHSISLENETEFSKHRLLVCGLPRSHSSRDGRKTYYNDNYFKEADNIIPVHRVRGPVGFLDLGDDFLPFATQRGLRTC